MRKNLAMIASFIGLVAVSACGSSLKNISTRHEFNRSIPHEFIRDMTNEGWTLIEDVGFNPVIEVSKLDLIPFLTDEIYISGEEMARRAKDVLGANMGQLHAEYILERQNDIPTEFRRYILVFPGTKWRDSGGDLSVPYLGWYGDRWYLSFYYLGGDWSSRCRLVRHSMSR